MSKLPFIWERPNGEQPAFPQELPAGSGNTVSLHGLTKREYMATEIIVGVIAANYEGDAVISAIKTADRLLAELAKVQS